MIEQAAIVPGVLAITEFVKPFVPNKYKAQILRVVAMLSGVGIATYQTIIATGNLDIHSMIVGAYVGIGTTGTYAVATKMQERAAKNKAPQVIAAPVKTKTSPKSVTSV